MKWDTFCHQPLLLNSCLWSGSVHAVMANIYIQGEEGEGKTVSPHNFLGTNLCKSYWNYEQPRCRKWDPVLREPWNEVQLLTKHNFGNSHLWSETPLQMTIQTHHTCITDISMFNAASVAGFKSSCKVSNSGKHLSDPLSFPSQTEMVPYTSAYTYVFGVAASSSAWSDGTYESNSAR